MTITSWKNQTDRIISALAQIPGGDSIRLTFKRYPRHGPGESETGYEEHEHCFPLNRLPQTLGMGPDAEAIVITLIGAWAGISGRRALLQEAWDRCADSLGDDWDIRLYMSEDPSGRYELIVFSNPKPPTTDGFYGE